MALVDLALAKRIKDLTSLVSGWFAISKAEKQEFFIALDRNNGTVGLDKTYCLDVDTFFKNQLNDLGLTTIERIALGTTLNANHKGRLVYDTSTSTDLQGSDLENLLQTLADNKVAEFKAA